MSFLDLLHFNYIDCLPGFGGHRSASLRGKDMLLGWRDEEESNVLRDPGSRNGQNGTDGMETLMKIHPQFEYFTSFSTQTKFPAQHLVHS